MLDKLEISFLWILRTVSVLSFVINVSFYCFLFCRWRLSKNTHWFLCNFAISELVRASATIISGVIWEQAMVISYETNNTQRDVDGNNSVLNPVTEPSNSVAVSHVKDVVDRIGDTCFTTTCTFALLILLQFYSYLKSPWSTQTLDLRGVVLVNGVWLGIITYVVLISIVADGADNELIIDTYNSYVSVTFYSLFLLSFCVLYRFTYRLFYVNQIELLSSVYGVNDGVLKSVFINRRKGIRYLLYLTVIVSVPVMGGWFESFSQLIDQIRIEFMIMLWIEKSVQIYTFLLGIAWPFVWVHLDAGLGKELRNATKYLKMPAKIENTLTKRNNSLKQIKSNVYSTQLVVENREAVI